MKNKLMNPNTPKLWDKLLFSWNEKLLSSPFYIDKINKAVDFIRNYKGKFLDIGIGVGNLERKIAENNLKLEFYGIDISPKAINKVKNEIKGDFYVSEIFKMPFKRDFFEVVSILDVLEHIYEKDNIRALREVNRVLKEGGGLVISVSLDENLELLNKEKRNYNQHVREYTFEILFRELKRSGFKVIDYKYIYAFRTLYTLKSLVIKFLPGFRKPNLLIVYSIKK
jgi:ubiquinone/menaquinone biosynthesis C-methylase UbiE